MEILKSILSISFLTFVSRMFGLLRDILIFSFFGTSEINSAFLFAFTIPNLFRRLLGEGALTSALIPVFADEYHTKGKEKAFSLLNKITSRLIIVLFLIVSGGIIFCLIGLESGLLSFRWQLCFIFSAILLPYMFFICLGALFASVLNVFGKFLLHASNGIWLNFSMILSLILGYFIPDKWRIYLLCGGVIFGGMVQMISLWIGLIYRGWKFHFDFDKDEHVDEVQRLFFPGALGAATVQINTAISRALAYFINNSSVSILYLANRLVELPLGLFVTAITTVVFPRLSNLEANGEKSLLREEFNRGIFLTLMIIFPAVVGMLSLDRTILGLLFHWKNFTEKDVALVLPVLRIFLLALPFYALSTYLIRGYHCKKNTVNPMLISIIHFATNIIFTLSFMFWLKSIGIALANLFSMIIQTTLLYISLRKSYEDFRFNILTKSFQNIILASLLMGAAIFTLDRVLGVYFLGKIHGIVSISINIPFGVLLYFGVLYIFEGGKQFFDWSTIWKPLIRKIRKSEKR